MSSKNSSSSSSNDSNIMITIVPLVVGVLLYYFTIVLEKEKCECSKMWQRDYIKYYSLAMIVLVLLQVFFDNKSVRQVLSGLLGLATLINIYAVYTYGKHLYDTDCNCAVKDHSNLYNFMVYYNYFQIAMLVFSFIIALSAFVFVKSF